jgi:hypothetical protein
LVNEALRHDLGHDLIGVVNALAPVKAQRESERSGQVARIGVSFSSRIQSSIDRARERRKNKSADFRSDPARLPVAGCSGASVWGMRRMRCLFALR